MFSMDPEQRRLGLIGKAQATPLCSAALLCTLSTRTPRRGTKKSTFRNRVVDPMLAQHATRAASDGTASHEEPRGSPWEKSSHNLHQPLSAGRMHSMRFLVDLTLPFSCSNNDFQ
ncbi:unnamed protein product [Cercospora beticola]|nr:unnamed protein product [Cercospora beticola]